MDYLNDMYDLDAIGVTVPQEGQPGFIGPLPPKAGEPGFIGPIDKPTPVPSWIQNWFGGTEPTQPAVIGAVIANPAGAAQAAKTFPDLAPQIAAAVPSQAAAIAQAVPMQATQILAMAAKGKKAAPGGKPQAAKYEWYKDWRIYAGAAGVGLALYLILKKK